VWAVWLALIALLVVGMAIFGRLPARVSAKSRSNPNSNPFRRRDIHQQDSYSPSISLYSAEILYGM
jgi:hypothetical protein